jgi:hypothetical protein
MKRVLILLSLIVIPSLSRNLFAGYVYPFRIISGNTTGEVDETQFSTTDITLSLTNLPGGGRRAIISIIGGGGGGSNNTILVAGNGLEFTDLGGGSNSLAIDPSIVATNPVAGSGGGITNVLDSAGGAYSLVGHTNQPTLLIKGFSNATPATLTITDFGTFISFTVASQGGFGSTNTWTTNGLPWAVSDTFGFSNASSVVGLAFTNLGGVPTIYLVPDSTIARTGQSQTWSAPQTFNSGATLTLGAPTWFKNSLTVSDNVTVVSNAAVGGSLTVGGNAGIGGNVNAGSFTGSLNGGNIVGNQSVGTNTLAVFGSNTGTIGSAGQFLVVHLNSAGIPDGWSTVTGNSLATSTNAISAVQLASSWNNGIIALSISNLSVATINGTTATVGFASLPFENITVLNGTTNFTLHGSSLTLSNLLTNLGITLTNRGDGQIDLGGTVSMLSNAANNFLSLTGNSSSPTQNWAGATSWPVISLPNSGNGTIKWIPNGTVNGVNPNVSMAILDGNNDAYIKFTRDAHKNGFFGIDFSDSTSGNIAYNYFAGGLAAGDRPAVEVTTAGGNGGLLLLDQWNNDPTLFSGYNFYPTNGAFSGLLIAGGTAQTSSNTPNAFEDFARFGVWTNTAANQGGALITTGSNTVWLLGLGRSLGQVGGTSSQQFPTNRISGFLAASLNSAQSNQTFMVVRDQTNGLWCIGVDTNGVLGAYRTNDLSTTVSTY